MKRVSLDWALYAEKMAKSKKCCLYGTVRGLIVRVFARRGQVAPGLTGGDSLPID